MVVTIEHQEVSPFQSQSLVEFFDLVGIMTDDELDISAFYHDEQVVQDFALLQRLKEGLRNTQKPEAREKIQAAIDIVKIHIESIDGGYTKPKW